MPSRPKREEYKGKFSGPADKVRRDMLERAINQELDAVHIDPILRSIVVTNIAKRTWRAMERWRRLRAQGLV